jgi:hypothetical protein
MSSDNHFAHEVKVVPDQLCVSRVPVEDRLSSFRLFIGSGDFALAQCSTLESLSVKFWVFAL